MPQPQRPCADDLIVIYILGYGRSGSTFLDILLHNHPEVVSVGALSNYFDWVDKDADCACGVPVSRCELWSNVCRSLYAEHPDLAGFRKEQLAVEARSNLLKLLGGRLPAHLVAHYGAVMSDLFTNVARVSGRRVIVDSSKSAREVAGRAFALATYTRLGVKLIHLVRDVRGVVWSAIKGPGSPERSQPRATWLRALNAAVGWRLANLVSLHTVRRLGDRAALTIRYKDLVADPAGEIERLGEFLGLDVTEVVQKVVSRVPLAIGHNLGGSRLRFSSSVTVKPDFDWHHRLPPAYRLGAWLIGWPLARRFGYAFRE